MLDHFTLELVENVIERLEELLFAQARLGLAAELVEVLGGHRFARLSPATLAEAGAEVAEDDDDDDDDGAVCGLTSDVCFPFMLFTATFDEDAYEDDALLEAAAAAAVAAWAAAITAAVVVDLLVATAVGWRTRPLPKVRRPLPTLPCWPFWDP